MTIKTFSLGDGRFDMDKEDIKRIYERVLAILKEELPEEALTLVNVDYFFEQCRDMVWRTPIAKLNAL